MSLMKNHVFDRTAFEAWASPRRDAVEKNAKARLTPYDANQATLVEAMAYAVTGGGKRIRALLVYAAGELTGAHDSVLTDVATACQSSGDYFNKAIEHFSQYGFSRIQK